MGTTAWSDRFYRSRAAKRKQSGRSAFVHDEDIRLQRVAAGVNRMMDPARIDGQRESRDSETHPTSTAVSVLFDVTGSMRRVPGIVQENLCTLFNLLIERKYLEHPAVLVGGIGDATCDLAPLQVGQFESGNEIEDDLGRLYLEGGGGGQQTESYELALYFLARKTAIDCYEKRGRKGYAFLIGDELPYRQVKRREVADVFGDTLQTNIPIAEILAEAREKYEIYFILPNMTSYYDDPRIIDTWRELLGQNAIRLADPSGISELIASTIGLHEEAIAWGNLADDLAAAGTKKEVATSVANALKGMGVNEDGTGLATF